MNYPITCKVANNRSQYPNQKLFFGAAFFYGIKKWMFSLCKMIKIMPLGYHKPSFFGIKANVFVGK